MEPTLLLGQCWYEATFIPTRRCYRRSLARALLLAMGETLMFGIVATNSKASNAAHVQNFGPIADNVGGTMKCPCNPEAVREVTGSTDAEQL
jgi:Na+/H+-translocating membrane pyrophosphatase